MPPVTRIDDVSGSGRLCFCIFLTGVTLSLGSVEVDGRVSFEFETLDIVRYGRALDRLRLLMRKEIGLSVALSVIFRNNFAIYRYVQQ